MSDCGTYNKHKSSHGGRTLIGNWQEEEADKARGDVTRPRYLNTFARVVAHYDNRDSEPKESINTSTYRPMFSSASEFALTQSFPNQRMAMLDSISAQTDRRKLETTYQSSICLPKTTRPGASYKADPLTGTFRVQIGSHAPQNTASASPSTTAAAGAAMVQTQGPANASGTRYIAY